MKNKNIASKTSALTFFVILFLQTPSNANDGTWTGGGTTNDWSDPTNWVDGIFAGGADATATLLPAAPGGNPINLGSSLTLGGISFTSSEGNPTQWALSSNADPAAALSLAKTVQVPVIDVGANVAAEISLSIAGTQGLNKTGSGSLTLSAANLYTGITTITDGTLSLSGTGTVRAVNLAGASSVFDISGITAPSLTLFGLSGVSGSSLILGDKRLETSISSTSLFAGSISGDGGSFVKSDFGTLRLSGANTYSGTTTAAAGTLQFQKRQSLYNGDSAKWNKDHITVASDTTLAFNVGGVGEFAAADVTTLVGNLTTNLNGNGLLAGSRIGFDTTNAVGGNFVLADSIADSTGVGGGSIGLVKLGSGVLTLTANNSYSGVTWIEGGEIRLTGNGTLGQTSQIQIIGNGSTLDLGGKTQANPVSLIVDGNLEVINSLADVSRVQNGTLNISGTSYIKDAIVSANLTGSGSLILDDANSLIRNGDALAAVFLSGHNTYSGETYVQGAAVFTRPEALYGGDVSKWNQNHILVERHQGNLGVSVGSATGGFSGAQVSTLLEGLTRQPSPSDSFSGGLKEHSGFSMFVTDAESLSGGLRDSAAVDGGAFHYDKWGAGMLTINGANTFTGRLTIYEGTVKLGTSTTAANGPGGDWTVYSWNHQGALDLNGRNLHVQSISNDYGGQILNSVIGTVSTITFGDNSAPESNGFGGIYFKQAVSAKPLGKLDDQGNVVRGEVALEKIGSSMATFSSDLYSPDKFSRVTVRDGELFIHDASAEVLDVRGGRTSVMGRFVGNAVVSGGELLVGNPAALDYHLSGAYTSDGETTIPLYPWDPYTAEQIDGDVTVSAGGTLGGHGTITGTTTVENGGRLAPGTSIGSLQSGSVIFANNSTYAYEVDSSVLPSQGADLLVVPAALEIGDMVQLAFGNVAENPESFTPGTVFSLINYIGSWDGGLFYRGANALEDGEEFFMGQNYWVIDYDATAGGLNFTEDYLTDNGSRFVTLTATAVPEPSSALLGAAASLLLLRRRRA